MIELYQELVPFTNEKTTNKVSKDGEYTNPIFMPLSFDVTSSYNTVESVLYIRNNHPKEYYDNVHICLLAPIAYASNPSVSDGLPITQTITTSLASSGGKVLFKQGATTHFELDTEYCSGVTPNPLPALNVSTFSNTIGISTVPISGITNYTLDTANYEIADVRFSLGYDEVSESAWKTKNHSIIIPSIGNSSMPDNSFIPVRMRITLNNKYGDMLTLRKFSVHIGYGDVRTI
jgi:hypothetical protein